MSDHFELVRWDGRTHGRGLGLPIVEALAAQRPGDDVGVGAINGEARMTQLPCEPK